MKGGFFYQGSKEVSLTIVDPSSYTDYADDDALVAQELRAAGINATFDGLTVSAWNVDVASGDFQLTMHWSQRRPHAVQRVRRLAGQLACSGKNATGDYERLNSPTIDADLAKLAGASHSGCADGRPRPARPSTWPANLPIIPMTTASEWFEYNSQHFVGWPTPVQPLRDRSTFGHQQRPRLRHR